MASPVEVIDQRVIPFRYRKRPDPYKTFNDTVISSYKVTHRDDIHASPWKDFKNLRWRTPTPWFNKSLQVSVGSGGATHSVRSGTNIYDTSLENNALWRDSLRGMFVSNLFGIERCRLVGAERSSLISRAEYKAFDKLKLGDAQWGETLAQWRQTAALFTTNVNLIARQILTFRRGIPKHVWNRMKREQAWKYQPYTKRYRPRKPGSSSPYEAERARRKAAKAAYDKSHGKRRGECDVYCKASQKFLEMQYGWRPLLADIEASLKLLSKTFEESGMAINAKSHVRFDELVSARSLVSIKSPRNPGNWTVEWDARDFLTVHRVEVSLWYKLQDIAVAQFSALGLQNSAALAWQLTPLSFLLDWVLPVGPWLESFTSDSGFDFISGTRSYKRVTAVKDRRVDFRWSPSGSWADNSGPVPMSVSVEAELFQRTVYSSRPVPGVYFKNPLSTEHVFNALALLVSSVR